MAGSLAIDIVAFSLEHIPVIREFNPMAMLLPISVFVMVATVAGKAADKTLKE